MAGALLLLVVLATTSTTAAARATTPSHQEAHYCKRVDAYRIKSCATALLPATPLGRQLGWELAQLAGEATTLTEAEVRAHFSAEFLTVVMPPEAVIQVFQQTVAERGPFSFVGFAYPPRARQALAILEGPTGERGALPIGVTSGRPALIEYLDLQAAPPTVVPKGRFSGWFEVGGRRLFLRCVGHGSPTVVFESHVSHDWFALQNQLAGFTRVCSWDHPSGPWSRSDPATGPRTARDIVADLHALLRVARVPGPYVLAGHSNRGLFSLLYASTYPRQVAGLVLIDAVHPAYHKRQLAVLKPLVPPEIWEALRQEAIAVPHRLIDPEQLDIWTSERQTRNALRRSPLRPMPLVVLARGRPDPEVNPLEQLWRQLQQELAQLVPGGRLVIATESGHDIDQDQPELVLDAIRDVVQAVRAGDPVPH
ncbi:MAG TPA: alpha/beta fold hydrolase [Actinomycetes bacterium]|nr:alpha/beta fold hydrolase [Actinomycetes bacterium]